MFKSIIGNILNIRKSINKITNINQVDKDYIEKLNTLCKKILDILYAVISTLCQVLNPKKFTENF